ncbi:mitochondrial PGP phosphatase-domain-containing protein [Thamnocephalis sphaerospora]|uniref:Mitochondrial PGP phosphatase-domain-containing protein n=1 Tax=Thamnocephalis sphaerospora TaxID=78915 RepID=A0A4V1IWZ0_9FUNG|nr:mitochondrial PGP phosphatase-domain-containing protein [Thamnocephalis sphaerospora]|eukprot:RKP09229.1 mitochondrial PGP phosphatase-domain-containing protein [Thamnocephalis sphaerospora]
MVQSWNPAGIRHAFALLWQPRLALPHMVVQDLRDIDFAQLAQAGVRGMAFDKDNCLTRPYEDHLAPELEEAWRKCRTTFPDRVLIVSNSAGTDDDVGHQQARRIEEALGVPVLLHHEKKPAGVDALAQQFAAIGIRSNEIAVVGDRLLTDVVYGHRAGALTILTRRVLGTHGDNWAAKQLRRLEHRWLDWVWPGAGLYPRAARTAAAAARRRRRLDPLPHPILRRLCKASA